MFLDQYSIIVAIGFSGASLGLTLFMMWIIGKSETHLLNSSVGLAFIVAGVVFFSGIVKNFDANFLLVAFVLLIAGCGFLYAGAAKFCSNKSDWWVSFSIVFLGSLITCAPFVIGYSGLGTIAGNTMIGILLCLTARQYWLGRAESPLPMFANAALYFVASVSFLACAYALAQQGQLILTARPANWAEDINSIVVIIGLTGTGALSLTLHQARIANRHERDAMTDALTGLLNRRAILANPLENAPKGTAVVVMDMDHFKSINDQFGHDSGDRTLKIFADLIRANVHPGDLAARIGGEEFCILLSSSSPRAAAAIAEEIRSQTEAMTIPASSGVIRTTVSAGVAYSGGGETIQSMLIRADKALYEAKAAGRNRVKVSRLSLVA
jgi:diguanylate cyclase (GGDEF)-like protein